MKVYLGSITLPEYTEITEITEPNSVANKTLDGTLYIDYMNYRRSWTLSWKLITKSDYDLIITEYLKQFSTGAMLNFGIPDMSINSPVYITISDTNRKYNNQLIDGFSIEVQEQYAIS